MGMPIIDQVLAFFKSFSIYPGSFLNWSRSKGGGFCPKGKLWIEVGDHFRNDKGALAWTFNVELA